MRGGERGRDGGRESERGTEGGREGGREARREKEGKQGVGVREGESGRGHVRDPHDHL